MATWRVGVQYAFLETRPQNRASCARNRNSKAKIKPVSADQGTCSQAEGVSWVRIKVQRLRVLRTISLNLVLVASMVEMANMQQADGWT